MSEYCPTCSPAGSDGGTLIIPGTLFCWKCRPKMPVGKYSVVNGQLAWTPAGRERPRVALAVLVGREQIAIQGVQIPDNVSDTVKLFLTDSADKELTVPVAKVVRQLADGLETVNAERVG